MEKGFDMGGGYKSNAAMKILFITSTRLGDAVLSTGLLDYMGRAWPDGKVTVACGPLPASIFEGFLNVACVIALKKQKYLFLFA